jgi:AcrR family transcriptional regulator
MSPDTRKSTQYERLVKSIIESTGRYGYAETSIRSVIAGAGVSRPTFYDYFQDRDACFSAAINDVQRQAEQAVAAALGRDGTSPQQAALQALVALSVEHPRRAQFLMAEAMAGGKRWLGQRDRGIARIARAVDRATIATQPAGEAVDLPARVLIGAAYRVIGMRLRRGEAVVGHLAGELETWASSYMRPQGKRRWTELEPGAEPTVSPHVPESPIQRMPPALPPGRPALGPGEVAENHRLRILYAVMKLAESKGYATTTVADIAREARIDGRAYYRIFPDKQSAFAAAHELGFQQILDATGKGYFSARDWPRRSWEGVRALTGLFQTNPLIAHVALVEAHAIGRSAVQRVHESQIALQFFLREGVSETEGRCPPTQVGMEAIVAAIFETLYLAARSPGKPRIAALLPHAAHVWLTPFLGPKRSDAFIGAQVRRVARTKR